MLKCRYEASGVAVGCRCRARAMAAEPEPLRKWESINMGSRGWEGVVRLGKSAGET